MTSNMRTSWALAFACMLASCSDDEAVPGAANAAQDATSDATGDPIDVDLAEPSVDTSPPQDPFEAVEITEQWVLPCLEAPVYVVRTAHDHPHIYASGETDLQCAHGFVSARDRYFMMEMARRFGLTTLSEIIGDTGLAIDIAGRSWGMRRLAGGIYQGIVEDGLLPEAEAYAAGVNAYVEAVRRGDLPAPAEFELAYFLLGAFSAEELLTEWDARAISGVGAVLLSQASFDREDLALQRALDATEAWGSDLPDGQLRRAGLRDDIVALLAPLHQVASAADWVPPDQQKSSGVPGRPAASRSHSGPTVERGALDRTLARFARMPLFAQRQPEAGFGSNCWAIGPELTAAGDTLFGSDGHLTLTAPSTFYAMHLDSQHLGDGDTHVIGLAFPGVPAVVVGTNGSVAWSQTQFLGDLVDWYREELVVENGRPIAAMWRGEALPLVAIDETYQVNAALGSRPGPRTYTRFETAGGRLLVDVEGTVVEGPDGDPAAINVSGDWIAVGDVDSDGAITGISVAYTGHFERYALSAYRGFGHSESIADFIAHHARTAALGANFCAADAAGDILYSGYQAMPCRGYLPRDDDGVPVAGANPMLLIDGSEHPSFAVGYTESGQIDLAPDQPTRCVLSYDAFPHAESPAQGFVMNANNDPFGATFDNNVWNDPVYVGGGAWDTGHRAARIVQRIEEDAGAHSLETVTGLQADHQAALAVVFLTPLLDALGAARTAADEGAAEGARGRMAAIFEDRREGLEEAGSRLADWGDRDVPAASGVATFYHTPAAAEGDDATATMIFHAAFSRFAQLVFADEGFPPGVSAYGRADRVLLRLLDGRGPDNPRGLSSWSAVTEESVFFDDLTTEETETADELLVRALVEALADLAAPDLGDGAGGFGTTDQSLWLWGQKHLVRFPSIVASYLGDEDASLAAIVEFLAITTEVLPLTDQPLAQDDPRSSLTGFPRPGAAGSVDAAGRAVPFGDYGYTHGPVMRLAVSLGSSGVVGRNIIPGGQSGFAESEHFADQAALWLGNQTFQLRFTVQEVVENAVGRELLVPE